MKVVPVRAVKPIQSANDYTQVRAVSVRAVAAVGSLGGIPPGSHRGRRPKPVLFVDGHACAPVAEGTAASAG
jgi:prepilin-type processing-associated H-X9-DG protein